MNTFVRSAARAVFQATDAQDLPSLARAASVARSAKTCSRITAPRVARSAILPVGAGLTLVLLGLLSPLAARASETLELIPDYAFFDLITPGLIADESGLGALWVMLIAFALLVFPLNALIFQPIFRALDARSERIQGARARSDLLQREADAILERYERAVREARAGAESARQVEIARAREEHAALTTQARQEAERQLDGARADLARSLETARASLRATAEELARAAAEQVLGRALS